MWDYIAQHVHLSVARLEDRVFSKHRKVLPGENMTRQHKLMVLNSLFGITKLEMKLLRVPKTRWWNLKGEYSLFSKIN